MAIFRPQQGRDLGEVGKEGGSDIAAEGPLARHETIQQMADSQRYRMAVAALLETGEALTGNDPLPVRLNRCAQSIVDHLGAAFARIWEHVATDGALQLRASAGMYTHLDGPHARIELGQNEIGRIAKERQPHITNNVLADPNVSDKAWAEREGMVSFAGYPLVVEGRLVGVLAMFAKEPVDDSTLNVLSGIGVQVALAIERDAIEVERERFRQLFLGMLGHDLRNPLGAIAMSAQMLVRSGDLPQHARALERICRSTDRMARMVSQLLDFAGAHSLGSSIPIQRKAADLQTICREVVDELRPSYPQREIVELYQDDASGLWDADRMAQVFSNLIENALSYGDATTPIRISLWRRGALLRGEVHNLGDPIPPDVVDDLFNPFRRVHSARTTKTKGLGLGLYITHQIIVSHGGTLFVVSSESSGTTFRFSLPVEKVNE